MPLYQLLMNEGESLTNFEIVRTRVCPDCNMLLTSEYSATKVTYACSLMLCLGLACWVPFVLDSCQRLVLRCDHC
jgi:hypothetical protein